MKVKQITTLYFRDLENLIGDWLKQNQRVTVGQVIPLVNGDNTSVLIFYTESLG